MDSVTEENVEKLLKEKGTKEQELAALEGKPVEAIWTEELDALLVEYGKQDAAPDPVKRVVKRRPPHKKLAM